jgi:hypothetical protein
MNFFIILCIISFPIIIFIPCFHVYRKNKSVDLFIMTVGSGLAALGHIIDYVVKIDKVSTLIDFFEIWPYFGWSIPFTGWLMFSVGFIMYATNMHPNNLENESIGKVFKQIGILFFGFVMGFIVLTILSFFAIKFCVYPFVGQDQMSRGISGSLFLSFVGLPIACIGGVVSGIILLKKLTKPNKSCKTEKTEHPISNT